MKTKLLAKYEDGKPLDLRNVDTQNGEYITKLREAGFLDFVEAEQPICEAGKVAVDSFKVIDGKLVQSWEIKAETTL